MRVLAQQTCIFALGAWFALSGCAFENDQEQWPESVENVDTRQDALSPESSVLLSNALVIDELQKPFGPLKRQEGKRRVVTILWSPEDPGQPNPQRFNPSAATLAMQRVRDYYLENSGGALDVENVATLGFYASQKPGAHYWEPHAGNEQNDGWSNGDVEKWAEAIRRASDDFDFAQYDFNGDGTVNPDELGIVIMIPHPTGAAGFVRGLAGQQLPTWQPLIVDGVKLPLVAEIYVHAGAPHIGLICHELAHALFGHADMYWGFFQSYAAGVHSLMDNGWAGGHLDPFSKLKFGWLHPRIIKGPGTYELNAVETSGEVAVILHPQRGTREYFLIENRYRGTSFDRGLPSDGLAIWHIMEDPAVYGQVAAPPHVDATQWSKVGASDWAHRAIRLLRPQTAPPYNDALSLWNGAEPARSYILSPEVRDPSHTPLRWGNGHVTNFEIGNFSAAGPRMSFSIGPWSQKTIEIELPRKLPPIIKPNPIIGPRPRLVQR